MQRRGVFVGIWVLCTAGATLIAWAAVSQVTQEVSPQAVMPLPTTAAIADLSPTPASSEGTQVAGEGRRPADGTQARQPTPTSPAATQPEQDGNGETEPPEAEDRPDAPEETSTVTEAYDLVGGVVTVRYRGTSANLVEASPESGFVAEVRDGGPGKVDVRFRSDDHESRLVTRVRAGEPDPDIEERPR